MTTGLILNFRYRHAIYSPNYNINNPEKGLLKFELYNARRV